MDEQTQLKDSILAQAHEKGRKLLEEAKETILKEETALFKPFCTFCFFGFRE